MRILCLRSSIFHIFFNVSIDFLIESEFYCITTCLLYTSLGKLIEYFPKEIRNYCFEADITNDELTFSYKLREGIAQNMNACFLMKKMGLIIND